RPFFVRESADRIWQMSGCLAMIHFSCVMKTEPGSALRGVVRTVRKIAILPTLLTLGNAVCGFAAIAFASKITTEADVNFAYSATLIFAAMVFDALDGYAARLSKTASDFGGQLDSLCDAISFGVAPGFLLLRLGLGWGESPLVVQKAIAAIGALYMACAVLRLARFNVENAPD